MDATADGRCAMCGHGYTSGQRVSPFAPPPTFMDYPALAASSSRYVCRFCDAVGTKAFMQTHLKTVMCAEGIFPAASNDHLAHWLQNPPCGNWLFIQGDQKVQHQVWRAPVNTSTDMFKVRAGELVLTVRRDWMMRGLHAAQQLARIATDLRTAKSGSARGAPLKSPFVSLSRDIDSCSQGQLRHELVAHAVADEETRLHVRVINALTAGELWGLTSVMYAKNPHRPERITTVADDESLADG